MCARTHFHLVQRAAPCEQLEWSSAAAGWVGDGMAIIGFIGAGNIGTTVARLALQAGHHVILSNSRGPDSLAALARELGPRARAGTAADAACEGDLVVLAIPLRNLAAVSPGVLAGSTVIDTLNHYPDRDGEMPHRGPGATTSRVVQQHLAGSTVVRAFSNIYAGHLAALARARGAADRTVLPIAGDDGAAKERVGGFLDGIGYDVLDAGGLDESWRSERGTPAYCLPYAFDARAFAASAPGRRPEAARAASMRDIQVALASA